MNPFKPNEVETVSGRRVDVLDPCLDTIELEDIATALSRICRFNGHTRAFYSVAQHSMQVADLMLGRSYEFGGVDGFRDAYLWGLLHDAPEAYIGDIPRPVKHNLSDIKKMEEGLMEAVAVKFRLPWPCPFQEQLKACDDRVLRAEAFHLMPTMGRDYEANPLRTPVVWGQMMDYASYFGVDQSEKVAQRFVEACKKWQAAR